MGEAFRIYLAAPWKNRIEARAARDVLVAAGFYVTSRWLDVDETQTTQQQEAINDIFDIHNAQALVVLNLSLSEGKAWEQGYAYAMDIPIIAVGGPIRCVFQHLDTIQKVETLTDAILALKMLSPTV